MPLFFATSPQGGGQGERGSGAKVSAEEDVVFDPLSSPLPMTSSLSCLSSPLLSSRQTAAMKFHTCL